MNPLMWIGHLERELKLSELVEIESQNLTSHMIASVALRVVSMIVLEALWNRVGQHKEAQVILLGEAQSYCLSPSSLLC